MITGERGSSRFDSWALLLDEEGSVEAVVAGFGGEEVDLGDKFEFAGVV